MNTEREYLTQLLLFMLFGFHSFMQTEKVKSDFTAAVFVWRGFIYKKKKMFFMELEFHSFIFLFVCHFPLWWKVKEEIKSLSFLLDETSRWFCSQIITAHISTANVDTFRVYLGFGLLQVEISWIYETQSTPSYMYVLNAFVNVNFSRCQFA